ncbi:hypothetical protein Cni_G04545 [Canna indica]|uniref:Gamma-interferon-inducible lysosomal thiol reductase n=1 Tax=Canna indica TaxID=4628 RepID=A0AAQ3JSW7_9LILI|nr:hypothetical protein Cni_G04545 [Canna indica]
MVSSRLLLFFFILPFSPLSAAASGSASKVSLGLYYESLCPYSANFIVNYLAKIFDDGLISIVDLDLVPYGNARIRNGTMVCQHGPYECLLNTVEACAINSWPDLNKHFRFIYCVESLVAKHKYFEWQSCFSETGLDSAGVLECYDNEYGKELELKYAVQTDALDPPHKYVPWVVVDGQPLYEDYENFEAYVCKAYSGEPPKVCSELSLITNQVKEATGRISYADGISSTTVSDDKTKIKMVI